MDRNGREEDLGAPPGDYIVPRVSPDGLRVALDVGGPDRNIWVWDIRRKLLECVTLNPAEDGWPRWSPDGRWLFFASRRDGLVPNIYMQAADRSGSAERVIVSERLQHPAGFAPDGKLLITERAPDNGLSDIVAYSFDTRRVEPVITGGDEGAGSPMNRSNRARSKCMCGPIRKPARANGRCREAVAARPYGLETRASSFTATTAAP